MDNWIVDLSFFSSANNRVELGSSYFILRDKARAGTLKHYFPINYSQKNATFFINIDLFIIKIVY